MKLIKLKLRSKSEKSLELERHRFLVAKRVGRSYCRFAGMHTAWGCRTLSQEPDCKGGRKRVESYQIQKRRQSYINKILVAKEGDAGDVDKIAKPKHRHDAGARAHGQGARDGGDGAEEGLQVLAAVGRWMGQSGGWIKAGKSGERMEESGASEGAE